MAYSSNRTIAFDRAYYYVGDTITITVSNGTYIANGCIYSLKNNSGTVVSTFSINGVNYGGIWNGVVSSSAGNAKTTTISSINRGLNVGANGLFSFTQVQLSFNDGYGATYATAYYTIPTIYYKYKPIIDTQPQNTIGYVGKSVTLSVIAHAEGNNPSVEGLAATTLTYQWYKNGVAITAATSASYNITSVALTDLANYYCTIASYCGTVPLGTLNSNTVSLTVYNKVLITNDVPSSSSQSYGTTTTFAPTFNTANAGPSTVTYLWQESTDNATWTNASGTNNGATYTTPSSLATFKYYRINVINDAGYTTGSSVKVVIGCYNLSTSYKINGTTISVDNPLSNAQRGSTVAITTTYTNPGAGSPTFKWYKSTDSGSTWTQLSDGSKYSGSTTATLTITSVQGGIRSAVNDNGLYGYHIISAASDGGADVAGSNVSLNVIDETSITSQPQNISVNAGTNATFVSNVDGTATLTTIWQYNAGAGWYPLTEGAKYSNVASNTLTVVNCQSSDHNTQFRRIAYNQYLQPSTQTFVNNTIAYSSAATLNVVLGLPTFTTSTTPLYINKGSSPTLSVTAASRNGSLSYQWQKSLSDGITFNNIAGATSSSYTISNAVYGDTNTYRCIITNSFGSTNANIIVNVSTPISFDSTIASQTVNEGDSVSFSCNYQGSFITGVNWYKNGTGVFSDNAPSINSDYNLDISTAHYTSTYSIPSSSASNDNSNYTVVVANGNNTATSNIFGLTVILKPVIVDPPATLNLNEGDSNISLTVLYSAKNPTFLWLKNGAVIVEPDISGKNTDTIVFNKITSNYAGVYTLQITNSAGTTTSKPIYVSTDSVSIYPPVITPYSFYYSDMPIYINGGDDTTPDKYIPAANVSLSFESQLPAKRRLGKKIDQSDQFRQAPALQTKLSFISYVNTSYTGSLNSILKSTGSNAYAITVGNNTYSGCYLNNYTIQVSPFKSVMLSADYLVTIPPIRQAVAKSNALSFSDNFVSGMVNGATCTVSGMNQVVSSVQSNIKFAVTCSRIPSYKFKSVNADVVFLDSVEKIMDISSNNLTNLINFQGSKMQYPLSISLKDPQSSTAAIININSGAFLTQQQASIQESDILLSESNIKEIVL